MKWWQLCALFNILSNEPSHQITLLDSRNTCNYLRWDDESTDDDVSLWTEKQCEEHELMHDEHVIDSLNELTKAAIEINNKLYKKIMKWKYNEENWEWTEFISNWINELYL